MKADFNPNYSNNSVNFGALKSVSGMDKLRYFAGNTGEAAHDLILFNLRANTAFGNLCEKFDVDVVITPLLRQMPDSILLEKALNLEIVASKLEKKGFFNKLLGIFKKRHNPVPVAKYTAVGTEAKTKIYNLARNITDNFIEPKEGLEVEINKFLDKALKNKSIER